MIKLLSHSLLIFFIASYAAMAVLLSVESLKLASHASAPLFSVVYAAETSEADDLQLKVNSILASSNTSDKTLDKLTLDYKMSLPEPEQPDQNLTNLNNHRYSTKDLNLLSKLVHAETRGEAYAGKVAVATVVLNRVDSSEFPNTIQEVILEEGQFQPVSSGVIWKSDPSEESKNAVADAIRRSNTLNGAVWFMNPKTSTTNWIAETQEQVKEIGNHVFYK